MTGEAAALAEYGLKRCRACRRILEVKHLGADARCTDKLDCVLAQGLRWRARKESGDK